MSDIAVVVFTVEGLKTILQQEGTQYWTLDRDRAKESAFVVCVQNQWKSENQRGDWKFATATEPHGTAFLIGRIADIELSGHSERWFIRISEYAKIHVLNVWKGWRFPIRYMPLSDLGIDPGHLTFLPVPKTGSGAKKTALAAAPSNGAARPLSIPEAKRGLAVTFGVNEDAIEITIRG